MYYNNITLKSLFVFLFFGNLYIAQTNRFFYQLSYKNDSLSVKHRKMNMILDITDSEVKFYDLDRYKLDSANETNIKMNVPLNIIVKRNINENKNINYVFIWNNYYRFLTEDLFTWKLCNEFKSDKNFKLQKATTQFGNREWIAWFCNDIPYTEGPYKFKGLPGLIFEIYDTKDNFRFILSGMKKLNKLYDTKNVVETDFGHKPLSITFEKYQELMINDYENPFNNDAILSGDNWQLKINGKIVSNRTELNEHRKYIQKEKLKNNNPIELNRAIIYK